MTREEAIQVLSQRPMIAPSKSNKQKMFEEATDMAIEALRREEAEANGYCHRIRPKNVEVVVRCKDCIHSRVYGKTTRWLACENVMEGQATDPDGYCYLGERSEP